MKKQLLKSALIAMAGIGIMSGSALALQIGFDTSFDSGSPELAVADQTVTDTNTNVNWVAASYAAGIWNASANGINLSATNAEFDLNSVALSSSGRGDMYVMLQQENISNAPGWNVTVGGTTDGQVEFFLLVDTGNGVWANLPGLSGTSGSILGNFTDNFSFSQSFDATGLTGTYSIILGAHIYHNGLRSLENTSFDLAATAVPEPATMLLFGTGLIGLASVGRRKRTH